MHSVKMSLGEIASHSLTHSRVESEGHPRVTGVDGTGVGPAQLPVVPEVERFLAIVEDMLIDFEVKGVAAEGDLRVHVETGELAFVVMGKTRRENCNVERDT